MHAFSQGDWRVFNDRQASPRVNGNGQDDQGNQSTLVDNAIVDQGVLLMDNGALPYSSTSTIRSPSENISQVKENNAQPLSKRPVYYILQQWLAPPASVTTCRKWSTTSNIRYGDSGNSTSAKSPFGRTHIIESFMMKTSVPRSSRLKMIEDYNNTYAE